MPPQGSGLPPRRLGGGRYELLTPLGEGGMGIVYLAHDTALRRDVALKTLRLPSPDAVYQLKKEFRSLANLSHSNLVQLFDLVVDDDQCFFTMELIDGVDLVHHLRRGSDDDETEPPPGLDYAQVRAAFHQLVTGLQALHRQGTVHRDVKPANVLVDRAGRVVLLDFGLASAISSEASLRSRAGTLAGTLAYMAPEQVASGTISPATDWYSVGLVLYECLTGRNAYEGPALLSAVERTRQLPPSPRTHAPETPADLDALVVDLLQIDPARRPTVAQLVERLRPTRSPHMLEPTPTPREEIHFVGRHRELAALRDAFDAARRAPVTVCVRGPSGIGKTALVDRFLSDLPVSDELLILRARCHPRESIPFKAVDGAIDDLTRFLLHSPADEIDLVGADIGALVRIFGVLGRLPSLTVRTDDDESGREPLEIRRRAFHAFRHMLATIGARRQLVLWIDDLQWGDLDSVALLRTLCAKPDPPPLLLILSYRGDEEPPPVTHLLATDGDAADAPTMRRHLDVVPLPEVEARELARHVMADAGGVAHDAALETVVSESAGNPFLTGELARYLAERVAPAPGVHASDLVARRVAELPAADLRLLEVVAVAGAPIEEAVLVNVAGGADSVRRALSRLRAARLLRTATLGDHSAVDTYHDRVREAVIARLSSDSYRALHRTLASAIEALPDPDPQRLVDHYLQADDLARASEHAVRSAERAVQALAFERASRLYRRALELDGGSHPRWSLHAHLAGALVNLGRGGEAGASFLAAAQALDAQEPGSPDVSKLKRQAAEHYLRAGLYDDGLRVLREVLAGANLPYITSPNRVLFSLVANRARLWLRASVGIRPAALTRDPRIAERLEVCWSAGLGLGVSDTLRAADYQARHALLTQRVGDARHSARALAIEGLLQVWEGGGRKRRRAAHLRVESERLAQASGDANVQGYTLVLRAVGAFFERRLRSAVDLTERAEAYCRDHCAGAAWELANVQTIAVSARVLLGDVLDIRHRVDGILREARERGDQYCLLMIRAGYCNLAWLAADEVEEAQRQLDAALAQPFPAAYTWPVYQRALAQPQIDLYRGETAAGWQRMAQVWAQMRAGSLLRFQPMRIEMRELYARCAMRLAAAGDPDRRSLLRFVERQARRISAEDAPWATPFVDALRGGLEMLRGDTDTARDQLERAALAFDHLDMRLHAAAIRYQLMAHSNGAVALGRREEASAWMRDHGVRNPPRMAAMLAPWGSPN